MAAGKKLESVKALQAFEDYCGMGPKRSLEALIQVYTNADAPPPTLHLSTLKAWSTKYHWQERLILREEEIAAEASRELAKRRADAAEDRLKHAERLRNAGMAVIEEFVRRVEAAQAAAAGEEVDPGVVTLQDLPLPHLEKMLQNAIKALEVANREERLDLGEATDRTEHVSLDAILGALPPEIREQIRGHLADRLRH